jgi:hypothetical protein
MLFCDWLWYDDRWCGCLDCTYERVVWGVPR